MSAILPSLFRFSATRMISAPLTSFSGVGHRGESSAFMPPRWFTASAPSIVAASKNLVPPERQKEINHKRHKRHKRIPDLLCLVGFLWLVFLATRYNWPPCLLFTLKSGASIFATSAGRSGRGDSR